MINYTGYKSEMVLSFLMTIFLSLFLFLLYASGQDQFKSNGTVVELKIELLQRNINSERFKINLRDIKNRVRIEFEGKNLNHSNYILYRVQSCKPSDDSLNESNKLIEFKSSTKSYFTEKSIDGTLNPIDPNAIRNLHLILVNKTSKGFRLIGCGYYSYREKVRSGP